MYRAPFFRPVAVLALALVAVCSGAGTAAARSEGEGARAAVASGCESQNVPPVGSLQALGFGKGRDQSQAARLAFDDARVHLTERVCSGQEQARCAYYQGLMAQWEYTYNPRERNACASYVIPRDYATRETALLEGELTRTADRIADLVSGHSVAVGTPQWDDGCLATEAGFLSAYLESALASGKNMDVRRTGSDFVVRLSLAPGPRVSVRPILLDRAGTERVLGGFSFDGAQLGIKAEARSTCTTDRSIGLPTTPAPADGLRVALSVVGHEGAVFCEGQQATPTIMASQPAEVAVFSIDSRGEALRVWSGTTSEGGTPTAMDDLTFIRMGAGDERLLVVAYSVGRAGPRNRLQGGACRVSGGLDIARDFPGASVDSRVFHVAGPGEGSCAAIAEAESLRDQQEEWTNSQPVCLGW